MMLVLGTGLHHCNSRPLSPKSVRTMLGYANCENGTFIA